MSWYVYIIESELDGDYYKGISANYEKRLEEHNAGRSRFTSRKRPWKLRYVERHESKQTALLREKQLKRQNRHYLDWLFKQPTNILLQKQ